MTSTMFLMSYKALQSRRSTAHRGRRLPLMVGGNAFVVGIIAAIVVWLGVSGKSPQAYTLAPESALPAAVRRASPHVQEAYRFAIANRETLRWIPCFCGCGHEGHTSNADCYIKDVKPDGSIVFDFMSLHGKICIDITRDVMRMLDDGVALKGIRAHVDRTYSHFGPSTPTPPVPGGGEGFGPWCGAMTAGKIVCMLTAFGTSCLFLVSYPIYHYQVGSKPFAGQGWLRVVYFPLLVSLGVDSDKRNRYKSLAQFLLYCWV